MATAFRRRRLFASPAAVPPASTSRADAQSIRSGNAVLRDTCVRGSTCANRHGSPRPSRITPYRGHGRGNIVSYGAGSFSRRLCGFLGTGSRWSLRLAFPSDACRRPVSFRSPWGDFYPSPSESLGRRHFANSDGTTSQLRLGRVQGLLEAGVLAGYWRKRDLAAAAELVQHRYRLSKVRDVLLRGDEVKLWKVTDIAEFLGVSTQRVDQLALAGRFPAPSGLSGRTRLWERSDVQAWAEGNWWAGDGPR
jgi:predicted DNA-binding transcriptional regulator AlpA